LYRCRDGFILMRFPDRCGVVLVLRQGTKRENHTKKPRSLSGLAVQRGDMTHRFET